MSLWTGQKVRLKKWPYCVGTVRGMEMDCNPKKPGLILYHVEFPDYLDEKNIQRISEDQLTAIGPTQPPSDIPTHCHARHKLLQRN